MSGTKHPLKVFLCHAHDDKLKTRELYRYLRKRGIQPWLDAENLVGGQDWRVEIPKAIKTSDAIIICLSKNSINKEGFVQAEITFALEKALEIPQGRIFIIPARFEDCEVPNNLERFHWVDLFEEDGFPRLMKSLRTRAGQLERSTVQVPLPDETSPNLNSASEEKIESEAALEKIEREAAEKTAREKAEKETAEKVRLEAEEQEKQKATKEKAEREAAEKVAREKAEKKAAEKARLEAEELERQKAAKEKAKRDADEKAKLAPKPEIKKPQGNSNVIYWVVGFFAIVLVIWLSALNGTPSTLVPTLTRTPLPQVSSSSTPIKTSIPSSVPSTKLASTSIQLPTNTPTPLPTEITDSKGVKMALVPAGEFKMGISVDDLMSEFQKYYHGIAEQAYLPNTAPPSQVSLGAYYMDVYEVTNAEYKLCVKDGVCNLPSDTSTKYNKSRYANHPIIFVNSTQAGTYCKWRNAQLPTETEWEKAARGTDGRMFPWGNTRPNCNNVNYGLKNCIGDTMPVGSYESGKSPYGMYDMAGNVAELVSNSGFIRGGSWKSGNNDWDILSLSTVVNGSSNMFLEDSFGFRCALSVP